MSSNFPKTAVVIAGATAVGKSDVVESIAREFPCEAISADARQIYRGMVVGTAAPVNPSVPTHLVGVLDPLETATAAWWALEAARLLEEIRTRTRVPIIVGGTGLYIRALTEGLFREVSMDELTRKELVKRAADGENLHDELRKLDPDAAEKIHRNNVVRVIRALEIVLVSGKKLSDVMRETASPAPDWEFIAFHLVRDRRELYERINARVKRMFESGWIEEVEKLLEMGIGLDSPGFEAIGYREIAKYIAEGGELNEIVENISRATRRYAKRQLTWFENRPGFEKVDITALGIEGAARKIIESLPFIEANY